MASGPIFERNQDATIYVGGLDEKVTEELVWELFVQVGPVANVHLPKDRISMNHQGYGFVEFLTEDDADYAVKIMNMIKLFGKPVRVNKASAQQKNADIGANLFIGNLDPEADEKLLYDTFSAFGVILKTPSIQRDPQTGNSKGFAFISYASFEASDAAIEAMSGQYLSNRPISVSYAFKKTTHVDGTVSNLRSNERHGSAAERLLAAQNPLRQADRPHQMFATELPDRPGSTAPSSVIRPPPPPPGARAMGNGMITAPPPPPPPQAMMFMGGGPAAPPSMPQAQMMPPPPPPMMMPGGAVAPPAVRPAWSMPAAPTAGFMPGAPPPPPPPFM